ncbi:MAG: hypothetical protein ACYDC5_05735 [Candidatus Dormibacteria bacterium]
MTGQIQARPGYTYVRTSPETMVGPGQPVGYVAVTPAPKPAASLPVRITPLGAIGTG